MAERWVGITVAGNTLDVVDVEVPHDGALVLQLEDTWDLQTGPRPEAYGLMFERVAQYVRENQIKHVAVMASARSPGMGLAHLEAAELRGVVMGGAASAGAAIHVTPKSAISNNFGERKVSQYVGDEEFWTAEVSGAVKKVRREAAMLILAETRPRLK